jgi:hypothetical protein
MIYINIKLTASSANTAQWIRGCGVVSLSHLQSFYHRVTDKLSLPAICSRKPIGFSRIPFDKAGNGKPYGLKLA